MNELNKAITDATIKSVCETVLIAYRNSIKSRRRRIRNQALADAYISALSILIDLDEFSIIKAAHYALQYHSYRYPETMVNAFIDSLEFNLRQKKLNPRQQS